MRMRLSIQSLACALVALVAIPLAHAGGGVRLIPIAEPTPGMPACEEFYEKWEAPGAPPVLLAMAGFGREVVAAKDCVDKGNVPMACKHWEGLLAVIERVGPPLDESRGDIEQLMQEHKCAESTDPASNPGPDSTNDSQANPDTPE